jgi:hypothetical protein
MTFEDALFEVIEAAVDGATPDKAIYGASVFSTLRGKVNKSDRTIRLEIDSFLRTVSPDPECKYENAYFQVQNVVKVKGKSLEDDRDAQREADLMFDEIFDLLVTNPTLDGKVCDLSFFEDTQNGDRKVINIGASRHGSAYLYVVINP